MTKTAIIPARGGSTRLVDKNILPLGGKPLICHTIEAVVDSGCFDQIVVSTDSWKIMSAAKKYAISVHKRPSKYATEKVTVLDSILSLMGDIQICDVLAYFLPTCPFRTASDIKKGIDLLTEDVSSVVSVTEFEAPVQFALLRVNLDVIPLFDNLILGDTNSKFMRKFYRPTGGFYISWWKKLEKNRNFFVGKIRGVVMSKEKSIDINDAFDLKLANYMLGNS